MVKGFKPVAQLAQLNLTPYRKFYIYTPLLPVPSNFFPIGIWKNAVSAVP